MSSANLILDEPLTLGQETIPRSAWRNGKILVPISLFISFVSAVLLTRSGDGRGVVFEEPAITMFGASCPRLAPVSVPAMEASLLKHGIHPSPMARLALTQFAATRDPSMKAQVKEVYSSLDPETKAKLQKLNKDIVVRAETLADTMKKEEMAGAIAPLGFWDPAGFSEKFAAPGPGLYGMRGVELKHGRVCMLASLGFAFGEKFHPLVSDDAGFVSAVKTHFTPAMEDTFWPAFVLLCGATDLISSVTEDPNTLPGDFGFDPLGLRPTKPAEFLELQNKELSNGRLAMLASAGMIAQELVTGKRIF